ncbi:hypothetical protein DFP72DRAFT_1078937 [Ephemerocybe angulata]|uniref:Uncharacterized protein n=1 Tax=Ephemerocybe angulata TaxID=980116 RepID=A0A8H6LVI9_9AGAR|nr:hypothetical protein DFP72DRAFT_1078937 [Tulosesus angulatus]
MSRHPTGDPPEGFNNPGVPDVPTNVDEDSSESESDSVRQFVASHERYGFDEAQLAFGAALRDSVRTRDSNSAGPSTLPLNNPIGPLPPMNPELVTPRRLSDHFFELFSTLRAVHGSKPRFMRRLALLLLDEVQHEESHTGPTPEHDRLRSAASLFIERAPQEPAVEDPNPAEEPTDYESPSTEVEAEESPNRDHSALVSNVAGYSRRDGAAFLLSVLAHNPSESDHESESRTPTQQESNRDETYRRLTARENSPSGASPSPASAAAPSAASSSMPHVLHPAGPPPTGPLPSLPTTAASTSHPPHPTPAPSSSFASSSAFASSSSAPMLPSFPSEDDFNFDAIIKALLDPLDDEEDSKVHDRKGKRRQD